MEYWYFNNWDGKKVESTSLRALKSKARQEDGIAITIYTIGGVACIVNANGYVHP